MALSFCVALVVLNVAFGFFYAGIKFAQLFPQAASRVDAFVREVVGD